MLDPLSGKLNQYMNLLSAREQLVASNIANADTPGYKTQDVMFNGTGDSANGIQPMPEEVPGFVLKNDGNNVDLDKEARLLAENALRFSVASNLLRVQLKSIKMAIEGGGTGA